MIIKLIILQLNINLFCVLFLAKGGLAPSVQKAKASPRGREETKPGDRTTELLPFPVKKEGKTEL